jgi:hypothetical protein
MIPGMNRIPGVYGSTAFEVRKTDQGYAIGFIGMELWGGPHYQGSFRELALQIFRSWQASGWESKFPCNGMMITFSSPVTITFEGTMPVRFTNEADQKVFVEGLSKELTRFRDLAVFI